MNASREHRTDPTVAPRVRSTAELEAAADSLRAAGDQLVVDLGVGNLAPGQQLAVGSAIVEVTPAPHNGCRKFTERFGADAVRFTASELGRQLRLRGVYVRVVRPGTVRPGDAIVELTGPR